MFTLFRPISRVSIRKRFLSFLLVMSLAPGLAWTQSATGMAGNVIGADDEVANAAQAAEEALKSAATKGEATRGASGAIASLLTSSDKIICSAWIVSFRVRYRNMVIQRADAKALGAMKTLMEKVEKQCDKVLNPASHVNGGDADEPAEEDEPKPIYPYCPECDPLKRALDDATEELEHAQYELNISMRWTDFVEAAYESSRSKSEIQNATHGETPKTADKSESRMRGKVSNARMEVEDARAKLVKCLEKCNNRNKKKYSFLGNNPKTYALAGGAAVGLGLAASGGGGDPVSELSMSRTGAPSTSSVSMAPASPSYALCAGPFDASFTVVRDPGGHRNSVWMPRNMRLRVSFGSVHIRGTEPFVDVNGPIDARGAFDANGMGTVAGIDNVSVRMTGTLAGCTESSGTLSADYTMGTNKELPGGQAISYSVNGNQ